MSQVLRYTINCMEESLALLSANKSFIQHIQRFIMDRDFSPMSCPYSGQKMGKVQLFFQQI